VEVLFLAVPLSGFLFGGIVFVPYFAVYVLSIIARYRHLAAKRSSSLFLWGALNPLPTISVLWLVFLILVIRA
jgi:hypothetical protein